MPPTASKPSDPTPTGLKRSHVVVLTLIAGMTLLGGLMLSLEDRPAPSPEALVALTGPTEADPGDLDLAAIFTRPNRIEGRRWNAIVIHHSGMLGGSADDIRGQHEAAGIDGLGYHFVIGNGKSSGDGAIHVGRRWLDQSAGAHAIGPNAQHFNTRGIGICLVGDGERRAFTAAQLAALRDLVTTLQANLGIADDDVYLHREIAPTSSPGRLFPEREFRRGLMLDQQ